MLLTSIHWYSGRRSSHLFENCPMLSQITLPPKEFRAKALHAAQADARVLFLRAPKASLPPETTFLGRLACEHCKSSLRLTSRKQQSVCQLCESAKRVASQQFYRISVRKPQSGHSPTLRYVGHKAFFDCNASHTPAWQPGHGGDHMRKALREKLLAQCILLSQEA